MDLINIIQDKGYHFDKFSSSNVVEALRKECLSLNLEEGDHVNYPINKKTPNQTVQQLHVRSYHEIDSPKVPIASMLCYVLSDGFSVYGLKDWLPNEIGYQVYRDEKDWISPHRDRGSDQLLSVTLTLSGSAWVKIYESEVEPPDYNRLIQTDEYLTTAGTIMFLSASGLGKRVIHEVCPPLNNEPRAILNLRMRPTILKSPKEWIKNAQ